MKQLTTKNKVTIGLVITAITTYLFVKGYIGIDEVVLVSGVMAPFGIKVGVDLYKTNKNLTSNTK